MRRSLLLALLLFASLAFANPTQQLLLAGSDPIVDLLNRSVSDIDGASTQQAGIRVNSDGTVDLYDLDTGYTYSYDWITPTNAADSLYEVRITGVSFSVGSAFFIETTVEDTWGSVSADPEWHVRDTNSTPTGNTSVSFTLEIRYDGGATIDTATINLSAIWDTL